MRCKALTPTNQEERLATEVIGRVEGGSRSAGFQTGGWVKWDLHSRDVYVGYAGWTDCGKASSVGEAPPALALPADLKFSIIRTSMRNHGLLRALTTGQYNDLRYRN